MSVVTIKLDHGYFADALGAEQAKLVPEAVIRDAESIMEKFLTSHCQAFWNDLDQAIEKAIDDNRAALIEARAIDEDDGLDGDGSEDD